MTDLPRLAIIGDAVVERTGGGALLLYRVLKGYPPDRLLVIHNPELCPADVDRRLPGIGYQAFSYRIPRLVRNRFNPLWPLVMGKLMTRHTRAIVELVRDFDPEAILTVPHWYLWFAGAAAARRLRVPLHLIVHDDWPSYATFRRGGLVGGTVRCACRQMMGRTYRQAISRLCVSPGMEEHCRRWYGAAGTVLYPSWGEDSPECRVRVRADRGEPPVVAFCGMIHQDGTNHLLRELAAVLAQLGGHLDLYTPLDASNLSARGLHAPVVRAQGFFPAQEMGERLGRTAHALFLPASFEPRERDDISTLFPSKLADYTAIGLPVIVWGPPYSSAARWARENPGATVCVTDPDRAPVGEALKRLFGDADHATQVAEAAIAAGRRYFELAAAQNIFHKALQAGPRDGRSPRATMRRQIISDVRPDDES